MTDAAHTLDAPLAPVLFIQRASGEYEPLESQAREWAESGTHGLRRYNCDCLNAGPDGSPSDDDDAIYCERWVYLASDVDAALLVAQGAGPNRSTDYGSWRLL